MQANLNVLTKEIEELSLLKASLSFAGEKLIALLETTSTNSSLLEKLKLRIEKLIEDRGIKNHSVIFTNKIENIKAQKTLISGVKKIIAVVSGKGGVGKSFIASNLAVYLAKMGFKVGLADLDIHGPSAAKIFGLNKKPEIKDNKIIPFEKYGAKVLSMAVLVNADSALIWRGPMVSKAVSQLLLASNWGNLDYLVLDLPPGTGDIHISVLQGYDIYGAVLVSTPQEIALLDVKKALEMLRKLEVKTLGLIENMSFMQVDKKIIHPFGSSNSEAFAKKEGIAFLGKIPLDEKISTLQDEGTPYLHKQNNSYIEKAFEKIT